VCGIAGVSGYGNPADLVKDMLKGMHYRGPDDYGVMSFENHTLGMCRLRIRSDVNDTVPFQISRSIFAAYNGEIYSIIGNDNFILKGGADEVSSLLNIKKNETPDGMYSTAVICGDKNYLLRDSHGIKPLFYRHHNYQTAYCSEVKPLLDKRLGSTTLNAAALDDFLIFGKSFGDRTILKEINTLLPGHILENDSKKIITSELASHELNNSNSNPALFRKLINQSVRQCLQSDRTIALALSGGIDSSILAWELNQIGVENILTFSVKAKDSNDGITHLKQLDLPANGAWSTWKHVVIDFDETDFKKYLLKSAELNALPIGLTSHPLYFKLAEVANNMGAVVLLTGEGADEIFAGYESYISWFNNRDTSLPISSQIMTFYLNKDKEHLWKSIIGETRITEVKKRFYRFNKKHINELPIKSLLKIERDLSLDPLLYRTDLALMNHSIEGRVPFLHRGIPELASQLDECLLFNGVETKPFLRGLYPEYSRITKINKTPFRIPTSLLKSKYVLTWLKELIEPKVDFLINHGINPTRILNLFNQSDLNQNELTILYRIGCIILWHHFHLKN